MLKLYYAPGACSLAPHIALEETGERYELARVDLAANQQNSPDFLRLNPKAPAYSSMKAAVIGFTKSLGKELASYNIAVNCVTPAVAKTTLALSQAPDFLAMIVSKIPRGRMLELDEAASMICWLASAENSFTTAGVFDLSGGRATY